MKKLYFLAIAAIVALTVVFFPQNEKSAVPRNGALEALQFLSDLQTYPSGKIPEQAQYAAWQQARRMPVSAENFRNTDPWESMGPHNRGGRMLSTTFNPLNPQTLYAGSASGGLWRSYTAGEGALAWERVETGFPVLGVSCIAFPPNDSMTIFIGTGEVYNHLAAGTGAAYRNTRGSVGIGILRSLDGGQTWEKSLDFSMDQEEGIWDIVVAPSDPQVVYAATTNGVFKSTDGGDSWDWVLDVPMATDLVVYPTDADKVLVACGNFESPGYGLYRTGNGGQFWHMVISNGIPSTYRGKGQLGMAPSNPDIVYASFGDGFTTAEGASWLCRSTDFGQTWQLRNTTDYSKWQGWFAHDVAVDPQNPDKIVVIGIDVWNSSDGGLTLTQTSVGGTGFSNPPPQGPDGVINYVHSDVHDVNFHPTEPGVLFVCSDGGIHRSDDGGQTFASRNGGLQTVQFYNGFSTSPNNPQFCLGGLQDNNTIVWNGDLTWTRIGGGDGSWTAIHPDDDNTFFISSQYLNVRRTTNGGNNFTSMVIPGNSPTAFIAPYVISPANGDVMYAGTALVARTANGGDNWVASNGGNALDGNPVLSMDASWQDDGVVYVATAPYNGNRGHVFRTDNNGVTWPNITGDLPDRFPMDIAVHPLDDRIAFVAFSGYGTGHVYRTEDAGYTWEDISEGLPDVPTNAVIVDPLYPSNIYVGNDIGVFASVDNGATWINYSEGLTDAVMVFDLKISADRQLRIASHGSGAFQRDLLEVVWTSANEIDAEAWQLNVWPNPAKAGGTLNVSFQNPSPGKVGLRISDASGRTVYQQAATPFAEGNQGLNLTLPVFPKGIYTLSLETEKGTIGQRIAVL
ncbi:MAG: exo-alpha-sialidase [Saprospiraceae bacterium]